MLRCLWFHKLFLEETVVLSKLTQRVQTRLLLALAKRLAPYLPQTPIPAPNGDPLCLNGGLTIIPMPGLEATAQQVKEKIESGSIAIKAQRRTPVDVVLPSFGTHANEEPWLKLSKDHIGGHDVQVMASGPGTFQMIVQLLLLLWYVVGRDARRITVIFGYCPLSRSDKDEGDAILAIAPFVIALISFICAGRLSKIIAVDLHADQIVSSRKPETTITEVKLGRRLLKQVVGDALRENRRIVIAFPDDTAKKRYEKIVLVIEEEFKIKIPIVIAAKRRTDSKKSEIEYLIGDVDRLPGATVIMCDDEIATAGTNIKAAKVFLEKFKAAEIWSLVTHGVFCGDAVKNLTAPDCPLARLYVTDTIPIPPRQERLQPLLSSGRLRIVEWTADLAWVIYQHHWSESIRELR